MRGRVLCCASRVYSEAGSGRVRSYFRAVLCWACGESDRDLVGFTEKGTSHKLTLITQIRTNAYVRCASACRWLSKKTSSPENDKLKHIGHKKLTILCNVTQSS